MKQRKIYIGADVAKEACNSKESLDALAVALSIKITFVDSTLRAATADRVMKTLRFGFTRYKRAIEYGVKRGWLVKRNGNLIAGKIREDNAFNIRLVIPKSMRPAEGEPIVAQYKLTELCNFIRQAVLLFHVSKMSTVYDTITMATHPSERQGVRGMHAAQKRAKKWGMRKPKFKGNANRLSYARMGELTSCSKSKARTMMKSLVCDGVVEVHENYKRTKYDIEQYRLDRGVYIRGIHFGQKQRGCIVYHQGAVCVRYANSYTLRRDPIKFKYADA